jgi:hypothetical protein
MAGDVLPFGQVGEEVRMAGTSMASRMQAQARLEAFSAVDGGPVLRRTVIEDRPRDRPVDQPIDVGRPLIRASAMAALAAFTVGRSGSEGAQRSAFGLVADVSCVTLRS